MKHNMKTMIVVVLCLLGLAACATVGKDFDRTHVNDVRKGVHDKAQIRAWFGAPKQVTTASGREK